MSSDSPPRETRASDAERNFLGIDARTLEVMGAIGIAAGRLEGLLRSIAEDLGINPGSQQAGKVISAVRKRARAGLLPSHAAVSGSAITLWCDKTLTTLKKRDALTHSSSAHTFQDGAAQLRLEHLRTRESLKAGNDDLWKVARSLELAYNEGAALSLGLRRSPRAGVFLPNYEVDGHWRIVCVTPFDGMDVARPSDEEVAVWRAVLEPFPNLAP